MFRLTKKKYLVAGTAVAVVATGGIAFAYWTSAGFGNGSATTGTDTAFTVTVGAVDTGLTPDGPKALVGFNVENTGSGTQFVTSVTPSVLGTSAGAACTAANFAVSETTFTTGSLAAGANRNGSFKVQLVDTGSNQDDCKGVTVNLRVEAN